MNQRPATHPIHVRTASGDVLQSTHVGELALPRLPPAACTVTPAEVWIAEGEIARAQLDCDVALRADEAPAGVGVSDGTVTWMPALDQAGTHTIELVGEGLGGPPG